MEGARGLQMKHEGKDFMSKGITLAASLTVLLLCGVTLQSQMRSDRARLHDNDEEGVERAESLWLEELFAGGSQTLSEFLADDFTVSDGRPPVGKAKALAAAARLAAMYAAPALEDRRVRLYGDVAVSTGRILLTTRRAAGQLRGRRSTPAASAVGNLSELARREAAESPARTEPQQLGGENPELREQPAPPRRQASASKPAQQYRYTAVYRRIAQRWRAVALQLSPIP